MAKAKGLKLVVITPEKRVLDETAESVVIPAHDGELGVLAGRAPLMCRLGTGQLRYQTGGRTQRLLVDGGFGQVVRDEVTVLTDSVMQQAEITDERIAEAEQALEAVGGGDDEAVARRERAQRRVYLMRSMRGG